MVSTHGFQAADKLTREKQQNQHLRKTGKPKRMERGEKGIWNRLLNWEPCTLTQGDKNTEIRRLGY